MITYTKPTYVVKEEKAITGFSSLLFHLTDSKLYSIIKPIQTLSGSTRQKSSKREAAATEGEQQRRKESSSAAPAAAEGAAAAAVLPALIDGESHPVIESQNGRFCKEVAGNNLWPLLTPKCVCCQTKTFELQIRQGKLKVNPTCRHQLPG